MGYNKISRGGLQAVRVPIESFAGIFEGSAAQPLGVSPLQLIVDAVGKTSNYSVFSSQLLQILLDYKWRCFARRAFFTELAFNIVHIAIVLIFNMRVASTIEYTLDDILGRPTSTRQPHAPEYAMLVGWAWTTLMCF